MNKLASGLILKKLKHIGYFISHPERWFEWLQTFLLDIKYGKYLESQIFNGDPARGWFGSQNSHYKSLSIIFSKIMIRTDDVIVDIGCGKGRVFNWFLNQDIKNKLIGIEVDTDIAKATRKRLRRYERINIIIGNIEDDILPMDGTIFYLFNPFSEKIVKIFSDNLEKKIKQGYYNNKMGRPIIIYYNPTRLFVFEENIFWKIHKIGLLTYRKIPAVIIEAVIPA